MSKGTTFSSDLLKLVFNNTACALVGDASGLQPSGAAGNLYVSLHSANIGEAGDQTTNEIAYTGYARVAVVRSSSGWTITSNAVANFAEVAFPACTGLTATAVFWAVGTASSGAGKVLYYGALGTNQGPVTGATSDNVTIPGHTLAVDDRVVFYPLPGSTLPTGITEGTVYFVKTSATDVITISTTSGGATLDVTGSGDGVCFKVVPLSISNGITPKFAASAISITED